MLRKLLKYDLHAVARWWWIVAATLLGTSVLGAFLLRVTISSAQGNSTIFGLWVMLCIFYFLLYFFLLSAATIATTVLLWWRFYTHLYTDQGYLTFTLPVKRRALLVSKIINEMVWYVAQFALLAVCVLLFCLIAPPATAQYPVINPIVFQTVRTFFQGAVQLLGGGALALFIMEFILFLLVSVLFSVCLVQFCITVGAVIAKKHKLLVGIGIYYAVNMGLSFVGQLLSNIVSAMMTGGLGILMSNATQNQMIAIFLLIFLLVIFVMLAGAALFYCLMQDKVDRKLNLA